MMVGDSSESEVGRKQKGAGGLFRRNKNKESPQRSNENSSNKPPEPPPQRRNIFAVSPLRRQRARGDQATDNRPINDATGAAAAPTTLTSGHQGYDSYNNINNNMMEHDGDGVLGTTGSFDDAMSFHSACLLKNADDDDDADDHDIKEMSNKKATAAATKTSWLCRTKYFRNICNAAFDAIDQDESGTVDEKELYSGLLLIHLQLGMYAGPAACKPLDRQRVSIIFHEMDTDHSGSLDRDEFCHVMMLLFSNVLFRVMVQWSMTLLIVPCIAQALLDFMYAMIDLLYRIVVNLDKYSHVANAVELTVEAIYEAIVDHILPTVVLKLAAKASLYVQAIPDAVWNSIPLTLLSTILGMLVVPYLILQVDDFFQHLASAKKQQQQTTTTTTSKKSS